MRLFTGRRSAAAGLRLAGLVRYTLHVPFTFDPDHPLDRQPGEPGRANIALHDYWLMGSGRSVRGLISKYRQLSDDVTATTTPPTRRFRSLADWGSAYRWQERIARAEQLDREAEQAARAKALEAEAKLWAERRLAVREKDYQQADRIRKLADQILDESPKFVKSTRRLVRGRDGEPDREIITVALDGNLMVKAAETASKLQRLAAEMETEHTEVDVIEADNIEDLRRKRWQQAVETYLKDAPDGEEPQSEA